MANRRMFSLDVVGTDKFLELPVTAQCLYFHLGMRADDDGFISSPKQILKMLSCTNGDMKILAANGYIIPFESGIIVIRHWKQNNYIQSDRYKKTRYIEEKSMLGISDGEYSLDESCIQSVSSLETQVRLGKDSIVKDSINTISSEPKASEPDPSGILLILNDKTVYDVPLSKIEKWKSAYPAVDIEQELRKMGAWLDANPTKRKTKRGVDRFINTWLAKEQDRGGVYRGAPRQQASQGETRWQRESKEVMEKYGNLPSSPDDPFQ